MSRKKTHEEFVSELNLINPNVVVLSEYQGAHDKVDCRCKIDGFEWSTSPNSLLKGYGCPRCSKKERYTPEAFSSRVFEVNQNIEVLSEYKNSSIKVDCRCKIDGFEWSVAPSHLLSGIGCPKCGGVARKNTEQFKSELKDVNPEIEVLGEYAGNKVKIACKCLIDGKTWEASPNSLLRGRGCPHCSSSKGERAIALFLDKVGLAYTREHEFDDCKNIYPLRFDFYLHNLKTAIEYDGQQHFYPVFFNGTQKKELAIQSHKRTKSNDLIKNKYCKENGIKIIRIPYTEFNNIETILDKCLL